MKFSLSVIFVLVSIICTTTVYAAGCDSPLNVREYHQRPLYVNIPFNATLYPNLVPAPLKYDLFGGQAWISVLIDHLDKLEYYLPKPFGFVDTRTSGHIAKVNLCVYNPLTQTHGYMITSIDFQDNASGWIKAAGAILDQKIPSHVCKYSLNDDVSSSTLSVDYNCPSDNTFVKGSSKYIKTDVNKDFVLFIGNRTTKFLNQIPSKTVVCASEEGPGSNFPWDDIRVLTDVSSVVTNVALNRLGIKVDPKWKMCQQNTCFTTPVYSIVDHKNVVIGNY